MTLDLQTYIVNKSYVQQWYRESHDKNISNAVSILASATQTPCIALAFYLAEELGFISEIVSMIERLVGFYDYKFIENQPDNSPFRESIGKKV